MFADNRRARAPRSGLAPRLPVPMTAQQRAPQMNKATERVLRVLDAFADDPCARHGVTALSAQLGMTKNMVFRALATLAGEGFVVREAGGRYALGFRVFELRNAAVAEPDLRAICAPYLKRMHDLTGETVTLSIPVGFSSVVIDGIEGRNPVITRVLHGRTIPLHAGPGSRAILAFLSDAEIDAFLAAHSPLARITPTTIVEPALLWREIRTVRRRGHSIGYGDHVVNSAAVAFPVLGADGRPLGAIAVGTPAPGPGWRRIKARIPALRAIMDELNDRVQLIGVAPLLQGELPLRGGK